MQVTVTFLHPKTLYGFLEILALDNTFWHDNLILLSQCGSLSELKTTEFSCSILKKYKYPIGYIGLLLLSTLIWYQQQESRSLRERCITVQTDCFITATSRFRVSSIKMFLYIYVHSGPTFSETILRLLYSALGRSPPCGTSYFTNKFMRQTRGTFYIKRT